MKKDKTPAEDWTIQYTEQAKRQMAADPEAAEFVRDTTSRIRQAIADFQEGRYLTIDDALHAIGMTKTDEVDDGDG